MALAQTKSPPNEKPAGFELEELLSLREIIAVLQRHRQLIVICIIAGILVGFTYILFSAPRYSASTSLLIDPRQNSPLPQMLSEGMSFQENLIIDSQIEIITSTRVMNKVAKKIGLYQAIDGKSRGMFAWFKEMIFGTPDAAKEALSIERQKQARLSGLLSGLSVNRVKNTYVLAINYTSGEPQQSAKIANLVAEEYLNDELEAQNEASQRANEWLRVRLSVLQKELIEAEHAVEAYKEKNNIVQSDSRNFLISDQQLSELNSNLIVARAETAQAKARYNNIQAIIESGDPNLATSDVLSSRVIVELRSKYLDLSRLATEILRRQGKDHMAYRNLIRLMQDIQDQILNEEGRIAESYKSEVEIATSKEMSLQKELDGVESTSMDTHRDQIELRELQRKADSNRALYTKMLDKYNEGGERQLLPSVHARIINYAAPPLAASWPNKRIVLLASLFFGLAAGIGLAFLREQFEKFIWKAEDLEAATQRTCLGMLPKIAFDREKIGHFSKRWSTKDVALNQPTTPAFNITGFSEVTQLLEKQTGITTEIMRNVQLAVQFNKEQQAGKAKVISFVSARPGEGKSITSCFLAKHLAKTGARVALVDCDFRRPSLTHWFLPNSPTGFYELASRITENQNPKDIMMEIPGICHKTGQENLHFIPAKGANASITDLNLVSSGQMHTMITYLQQIFDVILIDLPPIMNIVDARMIANSIDSFILLAHWGKTDREVVHKALHRAPEVHQKTVGAMLTLVDTEKASRYGYYNYNYYYYYHHQPS